MSTALAALLGFAALLCILLLIISCLLARMAVGRGASRSRVFRAPHNKVDTYGKLRVDYDKARQWWEGQDSGEAHIDSVDGLRLRALTLRAPRAGKWALLVHGYTGRADNMVYAGQHFYGQGCCLLMPDCRGHGKSGGKAIGMGWPDRLDLLRWIQWILAQEPEAEIVVFGISMGAAAVMMLAGEPLPGNVRAMVEDCGYTDVWSQFTYQLKALFGLPPFPVMHLAARIARRRAGYDFRQASAVMQLGRATVPMLFIHGGCDRFVPVEMLDKVYAACAAPKQKLLIPEAGHAESAHLAPERYWGTVFRFLEEPRAAEPAVVGSSGACYNQSLPEGGKGRACT